MITNADMVKDYYNEEFNIYFTGNIAGDTISSVSSFDNIVIGMTITCSLGTSTISAIGNSEITLAASLGTDTAIQFTATENNDDRINEEIVSVTNIIHNYCYDTFRRKTTSGALIYNQADLAFSATTITDSASGFGSFYDNDSIEIYGSDRNDGYYTVGTALAGSLTVDRTLITETTDDVIVYALNYPIGLQRIAARMVAYDVWQRYDRQGNTSENYGNYSASYGTVNGLSYPTDIVEGLNQYRRPVVV